MNIKKKFPHFMMILNLFFFFIGGNIASANEAMEEEYTLPCRDLVSHPPEVYKFKISYYCENNDCPPSLQFIGVSTSTGEEYKSQSCREGSTLLFAKNGAKEFGASLEITKSQLPVELEISWLSWIGKLSSLKENIFNSKSIPLKDWRIWGDTATLIATLQIDDLFDKYGRQVVSELIIMSPSHGSQKTVLALKKLSFIKNRRF